MKKLMESVKELVDRELKMANEQFPLFASNHEGAAVILEEVEEADDEMIKMQEAYSALWNCVKENISFEDKYFFGDNEMPVDNLKKYAIRCACECIQVAAMCEKIKMK